MEENPFAWSPAAAARAAAEPGVSPLGAWPASPSPARVLMRSPVGTGSPACEPRAAKGTGGRGAGDGAGVGAQAVALAAARGDAEPWWVFPAVEGDAPEGDENEAPGELAGRGEVRAGGSSWRAWATNALRASLQHFPR